MENNNHINEDKYLRAQKQVHRIKGFYTHLIVYIAVNLFLAITSGIHGGIRGFMEPLKTTGLFWGIGLLFHWYGVFGKGLFISKEWEERKIREIMEKDKINNEL